MTNNKIEPLVSVVMCTNNAEQYIVEAIESILVQTYTNFEFIIWDDGSTDRTQSIVKSFNDDRIRYFYHENTGLGMALRLACEQAKGKYIARMDSDDISLPDRLSKEVDFLEKNTDYSLVSCAVQQINEVGKIVRRTFPCSDDKVLKAIIRMPGSMIVHPMVMMRCDKYKEAGGYLPIRKSQDVLFWSRLAKTGKFYNITRPLGKYRILASSLDHSHNPYKQILVALLRKMVSDENVLNEDIELYNHIFLYSKPFVKKTFWEGQECITKNNEERMYDILRLIIGKDAAEKSIVWLKNRYFRCKWKIL